VLLRHERLHVAAIVDVIEDQQPAVVFMKPFVDGPNGLLVIARFATGQMQRRGDGDEPTGQPADRLGINPKDAAGILGAMTHGVLDGGLRLADAA
jgi:hypothetical protein